jgi:vitamin B12 transporter
MPVLRIACSSAVAAAICLQPCAALADPIEAILVTATRTPQAADAALGSVDIVSGEELERWPAADVADALRMRTGIEIARTGGPGQQTSLFLRGTESNHVLLLVDGVRMNPGTIGSPAVQNLTPSMIDHIEIVKGPRSSLYGSDAIGGVVNVITRRGATAGRSLEFGTGGFGTRMAGFSAGAGDEQLDGSIAAYWLDSAGFPTRSDDDTDRGYRNLSLNGALRASLGGVALGARAWHTSGTSEYSDFFVTPVDQDFVNSAFAVDASGEPAPGWRTHVTLSHATDEIAQNQSGDFLRTRRWQADWQNDVTLGEHNALTAGVLLQREAAASESYGTGFDETTDTRLLYLQNQASFGRHQLLLAAGHTDHDAFGGHFTWNTEYGLTLAGTTSLWVAAGTAFRAPDATDRFGFGGSPGLKPESSRSYELGIRHHAGEKHVVSLVAFRNQIDNLIQYVVTDYETYEGENRNVARARIDGIEASWQYTNGPWLARAGATLQDPQDLTEGTRLLRRARENFTLALSRELGPHRLSIDVLAAGQRLDYGYPEPVRLDAYVLANLSATIALPRDWTMTARLENMFDEQYELARGYNTMDRSLFVSLRHEFR